MKYLNVAQELLKKLAEDFDVPLPDLVVSDFKNCAGCYFAFEIHIDRRTLQNLHDTVIVARHEFAHYLQDVWSLDQKSELYARRFEKNILALGILPKTQTKIVTWCL